MADASTWEERMALRAAERRAANPEMVDDDPHGQPGHIRYFIANSYYCSCGEYLGISSIALTCEIREASHLAAQSAFFEYLRSHGFDKLNGGLFEAIEAVLRVVAEEHPGFNAEALTAAGRELKARLDS